MDIIKLGKTVKRHIDGVMQAIRSGINSAVVIGLNNKIRTAFKRSYGFKARGTGIRSSIWWEVV